MGFKKSSIWISGPQIVPYQIRQNEFILKSTLIYYIHIYYYYFKATVKLFFRKSQTFSAKPAHCGKSDTSHHKAVVMVSQ